MWTTVRYSIRSLRQSPLFSLAAILTLGVGIGANAVVYAFANAVFIRPLPYVRESGIVLIGTTNIDSAGHQTGITEGTGEIDYVNFSARTKTLDAVGTILPMTLEVMRGEEPVAVEGGGVSASMWRVLGTLPVAGRVYRDDEDVRGAPGVVISERFQRQVFPGSAKDAIGKTLTINGAPRTVIGVMPSGFTPALVPGDLWVPLGLNAATLTQRNGTRLHTLVGRLKAGVTQGQASEDAARIAAELAVEFPVSHRGFSADVAPLRAMVAGSTRTLSLTLMAFVALLLMLACFNAGNLAFVRVTQRLPEFATHMALGAQRSDLVRRQLFEGALIGLGGGVVGTMMVLLALPPLLSALPQTNPLLKAVAFDWRVALFVAIVSLVTGIVVMLLPTMLAIRSTSLQMLSNASRKYYMTPGQRRFRQFLVAGQAAAASFLSIASLAMTGAMYRLTHLDTGLKEAGVYVAKLSLPAERYPDIPARGAMIGRTVTALRETPGIIEAAATNGLFERGNSWTTTITTDLRDPGDLGESIHFRRAWPGYFQALGIRALQGRLIEMTDRDSAPPIAVVSQSFAKKYYPAGDAIGHRIKRVGNQALPWLTVVGIVPDVRDAGIGDSLGPSIYLSMLQSSTGFLSIVVRTSLSQLAAEKAVRQALHLSDPMLPINRFASLPSLMEKTLDEERLKMLVIGLLAVIALILSSLGIYAVTAFVMTERTKEIAIRMAIGAPRPRLVVRLVSAMYVWILGGALAGLLAALAASGRWSTTIPGGVGLTICATACGLIAAVGAVATAIPALRASGASPAVALRKD